MRDIIHEVEIDMVIDHLRQGREGLDKLVSYIVLDAEQISSFELWRTYIKCMAELRNEDLLCRHALTLSINEFNRRYRFMDWTAAVEFSLISLARSKAVSESWYQLKIEEIYSRHSHHGS